MCRKEEKNDVLFDYAGDEDDEEKKGTGYCSVREYYSSLHAAPVKKAVEPQAKATSPKKVEEPVKNDASKDAKKEENFDEMEEWERELRRAAGL